MLIVTAIELVLTVLAWRAGWRWMALLPLGLALIVQFLIAVETTSPDGEPADCRVVWFVIDVIAMVVLGLMLMFKPVPRRGMSPPQELTSSVTEGAE